MKTATDFILKSLRENEYISSKFDGRIWDRNEIPENPKNPYSFIFLVSASEKTELITSHTPVFTAEYQLSLVCKSVQFGESLQTDIVKFFNEEIEKNEDVYDVYVIDLVPSEPRDNQGLLQYSIRIRIIFKSY